MPLQSAGVMPNFSEQSHDIFLDPISSFPTMTEEHVSKLLKQQRDQLEAQAKAERTRAVQEAYSASADRQRLELEEMKNEINALHSSYRSTIASNYQERNTLAEEREYAVQSVQVAVDNREKELSEAFRIQQERQHALHMQDRNERAALLNNMKHRNYHLGHQNAEQQTELVQLHDHLAAMRVIRDAEMDKTKKEIVELRNKVIAITPERVINMPTTNELGQPVQQYHLGTPTKDDFYTPNAAHNDCVDEIKSQGSIVTDTTYKGETQ